MNMSPLGRTRLIGLAVGATAGLGLIAFLVYRQIHRRRRAVQRLEAGEEAPWWTSLQPLDGAADPAPPAAASLDTQECDAQAEAEAEVEAEAEAAVQALSPQQQLELRRQLDQVLSCVSSLRSEVAELRGGLQDIALQIIQDVKKGVEDSQRLRRRRHVIHRERTDSNSSSSIYFTASQGVGSTCEDTSEGGYSTAYAESDYTDREEEGGAREAEHDSDEEEDKSCATVITLQLGEEEEEEERGLEEEEEEQEVLKEEPSGELALLLAQSDVLHTGDGRLKADGYKLLLDHKQQYGDSREFLWRLARAYRDMYVSAEDEQEKIAYGQLGREEAEEALKKNGLNAECHKWFAVMTALTTQHENLHGKRRSAQISKEHLDRAMALRDDDPMCFYLLGRWCYVVAMWDWLERRAAAALYRNPPSATVHDALRNFHQAEDLSPGFSRNVRLYIAVCYKELNKQSEASHWSQLALRMSPDTEDDEETIELKAQLQSTDKQL